MQLMHTRWPIFAALVVGLAATAAMWYAVLANPGGEAVPAASSIEAARHISLLDSTGMSHVHISGLTFRFGNVFWNIDYQAWQHADVNSAAIRVHSRPMGPGPMTTTKSPGAMRELTHITW